MPRLQEIIPELPTANLEQAIRFYQDVLGFEVDYGSTDYSILRKDDVRLVVLPKSPAFPGPTSCYIFIKDIDTYYNTLISRRARISLPLTVQPYGMKDFGILDLDGNRLSFGEAVKTPNTK